MLALPVQCMHKKIPYQIVLQFHGIDCQSVTLSREIHEKKVIHNPTIIWLILLSQLIEAITYIHTDLEILHNDIKLDNVLLAEDDHDTVTTYKTCKYQVVLSGLCKATPISDG